MILKKRFIDIVVSISVILCFAIPFFFLLMPAIIFSSEPLLFNQSRIGKGGRPFKIYKLRTMYMHEKNNLTITTSEDRRVTKLGRYLRWLKIDEFPQLWNVLIGQMSLVGPRPDVPGYADRLAGRARSILLLKPGITGPATLYFRNEEEILGRQADSIYFNDKVIYPAKVAINLDYIERWSLSRDIGFILITIFPLLDRWLRLIPSDNINVLAERGQIAMGDIAKQ